MISLLVSASAPPPLQVRLQEIVDDASVRWACNFSLGVQHPRLSLQVSAGGAVAADRFVWGSVTKQLTGTAILQAVEQQLLSSIDEAVAPLVDPMLIAIGLGTMSDIWGAATAAITVRHLASMKSGLPDYDTAEPHGHDDPLRASSYAAPAVELTPKELLGLTWVATGRLQFPPGTKTAYSSTNFVLLGLLLAKLHGASPWDAYDQATILRALPTAHQQLYNLSFGVHGSPRQAGAVAGWDRTSYNGANASALPGRSVFDMAAVFGGWTASDLIATAADAARIAYDLYGREAPQLLTPSSRRIMVPPTKGYGFATFNLTGIGGNASGPSASIAYGHLGATYGYDSIVAFFPYADVAIAVASDIETDSQAQPRDAICVAYNEVLAFLQGTPAPHCEYSTISYYKGFCNCSSIKPSPDPPPPPPSPPSPPIPPPDPLCPPAHPRNQTFFL